MTKQEFIKAIAGYVQKYAKQYGICVHSPIIAQAILESGWGQSKLAAQYHNYFGLKCGTKWTGKSVNMATKEEYKPGVLTDIRDNFRVFDSMEDGVKGYFEFIQITRYHNLRGITDPRKYLETIREDGYATSSTYIESNMSLVDQYNLTQYDNKGGNTTMGVTAQDVLNVMRSWIGFSEANGKFKQIIDLYNSHKPLARGYAVKYTDEWCDTTVSAAGIKAGAVDLIGTECGVEEHVKIFKAKGIWIEDGTITPQPGDIIVYNWDDSTQPNDGYSDHIGFVESVSGKTITAIEGNKGEAVARRTLSVGNGNIRGYARPKYASGGSSNPTPSKTIEEIAREVIAGVYGNGDARKKAIEAMGYDYNTVQAKVNELLKAGSSIPKPSKTVDQIAREVIAGKYGNGDARKKNLKAAGYNYKEVQNKVNELLKASSTPKKTVDQIAREVIAGQWGNGDARKNNLKAAGYDYNKVQAKVNKILNGGAAKPSTPVQDQAQPTSKKVIAGAYADKFNKSLAGIYKTTANLYMRHGAGTNKKSMVLIPNGTKVKCYGYYSVSNGVKWLYIQVTIDGVQYTGFSSSAYLKRV